MPLERARDSYQSLIKLAYAEHPDLNQFTSTSDLGAEGNSFSDEYSYGLLQQPSRSGSSALDGLEYEGEDALPSSPEPTYWQYGTENWKDYETTAPMIRPTRLLESGMDVYGTGKSERTRGNGTCFALFPFCDPRGVRGDDSDSDEEHFIEASHDVEQSILLYPPPSESPIRGIIRKGSKYPQVAPGLNAKQRKSFRPMLYRPPNKKSQISSPKQPKHVRFSCVKTEVRICPLHQLTPEERAQTWWSSEEFDSIKRSMMVLIQPSEIEHLCKTWLAADTEQKMQKSKKKKSDDDATCSESEKKDASGKSWWHKYGDSRRGLERYASPEEAPQIMGSYQEAVYQVLLEQERQRRQCECWCPFDSKSIDDKRREADDKIAKIYKEYTAWSRDLALASGASDADAVLCDFDDSKRKSREYFLLRQIYQNQGKVHAHMPDFMAPRGFQPTGYLRYSTVSSPVTVPPYGE